MQVHRVIVVTVTKISLFLAYCNTKIKIHHLPNMQLMIPIALH
jgi:hypothetical protein